MLWHVLYPPVTNILLLDQINYMIDFVNRCKEKIIISCIILFISFSGIAQTKSGDSLLQEVTLQKAVAYAIKYQPLIQQSLLDEKITASEIRSRLADWYPQINFNYLLQHNFIVQKTVIGGNTVQLGSENTSAVQFGASQYIFNRDALLARRTKGNVLLLSQQTTSNNKIDLAVNVSKAFYDVLSVTQQINVAASNIARIERSLKDAYNQYKAGIADKIDYKRATISLNNTKATKKINETLLVAKLEYLKSLMNYPMLEELHIVYDSLQMEHEIMLDTLQLPDYTSRIEYRLLETQRKLLEANLQYNKWSYLPSVSANAAYNFNFQNNNLGKIYSSNFPNSYIGLTLGVPIFQGGKRKAEILTASLELERNEYAITSLKNNVNASYSQALAVYKGNLTNYLTLKENVLLAKEVYDVIQLQYRSGIKTYLEVITSETDLRTAQINYYNALYEVLSSKIDVERELGQINY